MKDNQIASLDAAHRRSAFNRRSLEAGGLCGCFHCLRTFDATAVVNWYGPVQESACCPFCSYDTVLSSATDRVDDTFLREMQQEYFDQAALELDAEAQAIMQRMRNRLVELYRSRGHAPEEAARQADAAMARPLPFRLPTIDEL